MVNSYLKHIVRLLALHITYKYVTSSLHDYSTSQ